MGTPITQGLAPKVQQHLKTLIGANDPSTKITPAGFLKLVVDKSPSLQIPEHEKIKLNNSQGHVKNIELWNYSRFNPSQVATSITCDEGTVPTRKSFFLEAAEKVALTVNLPDNFLEQYMEDATRLVQYGGAPTPLMQEFVQILLSMANGLVGKIDQTLLSKVVFGTNVTTGVNTAKTININKNATVFDLQEGLATIIADARENEIVGNVNIVGGGLLNQYEARKAIASASQNGQNIAALGGYNFYYDPLAGNAFGGANNIGVFADGTIGFIDLNKLVGFKQRNLGTYQAFQIQLPIESASGVISTIWFDVTLRFKDCPETILDSCDGYTERDMDAGWRMTVSKTYGLFQQPANQYCTGDRLAGNNGALLYALTNECANCEEA